MNYNYYFPLLIVIGDDDGNAVEDNREDNVKRPSRPKDVVKCRKSSSKNLKTPNTVQDFGLTKENFTTLDG